jgi:hypothetical protein
MRSANSKGKHAAAAVVCWHGPDPDLRRGAGSVRDYRRYFDVNEINAWRDGVHMVTHGIAVSVPWRLSSVSPGGGGSLARAPQIRFDYIPCWAFGLAESMMGRSWLDFLA